MYLFDIVITIYRKLYGQELADIACDILYCILHEQKAIICRVVERHSALPLSDYNVVLI